MKHSYIFVTAQFVVIWQCSALVNICSYSEALRSGPRCAQKQLVWMMYRHVMQKLKPPKPHSKRDDSCFNGDSRGQYHAVFHNVFPGALYSAIQLKSNRGECIKNKKEGLMRRVQTLTPGQPLSDVSLNVGPLVLGVWDIRRCLTHQQSLVLEYTGALILLSPDGGENHCCLDNVPKHQNPASEENRTLCSVLASGKPSN